MVQFRRSRHWFLTLILLLAAAPATADVTARYVNPGGLMTMTVEVNEKGDTRLSQGNQFAVLTLGGVSYLIASDLTGTYAVKQDDWFAVNLKKLHEAMSPSMAKPETPDESPKFD